MATTVTTVLNCNSVTIWKKKKKRKRDEGIEEPVLTAPADLAFLLFALSPPRNRKYARGKNDAAPLVVAPVFGLRPQGRRSP